MTHDNQNSARGLTDCPFISDGRIHGAHVKKNGFQNWNVECACGALGPDAANPEEAERLWETRQPRASRADAPPRGGPVAWGKKAFDSLCREYLEHHPYVPTGTGYIHAALSSPPPALPVAHGPVVAWMKPDGSDAITKAVRGDAVEGGARFSLSSAEYSVELYASPAPAPALSEGLTERENIRRENYRDSSAALKSLIGMFRLWEMSEPKHPGDAIEQREKFRAYVNKVEAEMDARDARLSPAAPLEGEKA